MVSLKFILLIVIPSLAFAQTQIYRSMQSGSTSAIATNSIGTMTISGSVATFSSPLPDTIGVGCVIQYDSLNLGVIDAIVFIHGRTSSTIFTVKRASGAVPAAVSANNDWSIFHAYTSLSNAEAGTENTGIALLVRAFDGGNRNIVSANETWHFALYRGAANEALTIGGWTTGSSNYIRWFTPYLITEVGLTQRHDGVLNRRTCFFDSSAASIISVGNGTGNQGFVRFEGLQLKCAGNNASGVCINFLTAGADFTAGYFGMVSDCILIGANAQGTNTTNNAGVVASNSATSKAGTLAIWNSLLLNFKVSGAPNFEGGIIITNRGGTVKSYNNTGINNNISFGRVLNNGVLNNVNCISQNSTDGFAGLPSGGESHVDCISDVASDADITGTVIFVNAAGGDYHLAQNDTLAKGAGTDLSADATLPFADDIDSDLRGLVWDIGMDQITGISNADDIIRRRGQARVRAIGQ